MTDENLPESEQAAESGVAQTAALDTGTCPFAGVADGASGAEAVDLHQALRRRSFLRGAAVGAVGAAAVTSGAFGTAQAVSAGSGSGTTGSGRAIAFHGAHQAGILTTPQTAGTFVSFNVLATDAAGLQQMFKTLTERVRFLTVVYGASSKSRQVFLSHEFFLFPNIRRGMACQMYSQPRPSKLNCRELRNEIVIDGRDITDYPN